MKVFLWEFVDMFHELVASPRAPTRITFCNGASQYFHVPAMELRAASNFASPPPKCATKTQITSLERKDKFNFVNWPHFEFWEWKQVRYQFGHTETRDNCSDTCRSTCAGQTHAASASVTTSYLTARRLIILTKISRGFPRSRHENVWDITTN
jgi:hypothetical protein